MNPKKVYKIMNEDTVKYIEFLERWYKYED